MAEYRARMHAELVSAMERLQMCVATRDSAMAEAVLDEDFALVLVQPGHAVMSRDRWLAVLPDYVVHSLIVEDSVVDVDEDVAVVLHRDLMSATVLGADRSGTFVITDTWRRRQEDWRLWRRHSTPLTAGRLV